MAPAARALGQLLRKIGWTSIVMGAGTGVIAGFFYLGVALICLGLVSVALEAIWGLSAHPKTRLATLAGVTAFFVVFVAFVVVPPAAVTVRVVSAPEGVNFEGDVVAGVPWEPSYREIIVSFANESDTPYRDFDATFEINGDVLVAAYISRSVAGATLDLKRAGPASLLREGVALRATQWGALNGSYRVFSPLLPAHSSIETRMVIAPPDPSMLDALPKLVAAQDDRERMLAKGWLAEASFVGKWNKPHRMTRRGQDIPSGASFEFFTQP